MKKRGQFYLIAAIIIITVLFSLYSIKNYSQRDAPETIVYDLKEEFNIESGEVVEYQMYTQTGNSMNEGLKKWINDYVKSNPDVDLDNLIFVYGDSKNLQTARPTEVSTGQLYITFTRGSTEKNINFDDWEVVEEGEIVETAQIGNADKVTLILDNNEYIFNVGEGMNLFAIINKEGTTVPIIPPGDIPTNPDAGNTPKKP